MSLLRTIGVLLALTVLPAESAVGGEAAFEIRRGQRQLFLDEVDITEIRNLQLVMHQPEKKGAVIRIAPGLEGLELHSLQTNSAPVWDPQEKIWKLWCSAPGGVAGTSYWESPDGLHWHPPEVGMVEHKGSRQNNFIQFDLKGRKVGPNTVVFDPTDPDPKRRYKAALPPQGFAVSPDGIHWKAIDVPGVPSSDTYKLSFDQENHQFLLTVKHGGPYGRTAWLSTSSDFENWTKPRMLFHTDELDQELGTEAIKNRFADPTLRHPEFNKPDTYNVQVYKMGLFRYERLYIGLPRIFYQSAKLPNNWPGFDALDLPDEIQKLVRAHGDWTGFNTIQLMCSRDMENWLRLGNREPFIGPARIDSGAYDTLIIDSPAYPVVRGDELWFYYMGIRSYAMCSLKYRDQGAVNLAVLRRDGFISLDAGPEGGTIQTKPFAVPGGKLWVNVDLPRGELKTVVLGSDGNALMRSVPIKGDHRRGQVVWEKGDLADLQGQVVSVQFGFRKGSLYSYWFE